MSTFTTFSDIASQTGKRIGARVYLHVSAIDLLTHEAADALARGKARSGLRAEAFNVVRFDPISNTVTFLHYPDFFEVACPTLNESWKVWLHEATVSHRIYAESLNPPILHRKELLLAPDHPDRARFQALTSQLESIGLFQDPVRIGFQIQWERLLSERGFRLVGHDLFPIGNDESDQPAEYSINDGSFQIARHLTALNRESLSAPIQILNRFGFLNNGRTVFDYGCGRGDDVRGRFCPYSFGMK
jgi:hypothetical protein